MLRWAVLGTGFISETVAEAIAGSDGSRVELVYGRDPGRLSDFQSRHGIGQGVSGIVEAVSAPGVDAVYVGLPNHVHAEAVLAAAAAGKAVLCEKSLTTTMASAEALISGVAAEGTFFVEGLMYLAHPLYRRVVELLGDGRLGTIRAVSARYGADIWRVVNPAGNGTIYNLGCYPISLLHLVVQTAFGPHAFADRTIVGTGNRNPEGNISDAALVARFGCGILATVQSSDNYGIAADFSVVGDHGVLAFETNPWLPTAGDNVVTWTPHGAPVEDRERIVVSDPYDAFHHQIRLVERCVADGVAEAERPSPRHGDSLEIMALLTDWEQACRN